MVVPCGDNVLGGHIRDILEAALAGRAASKEDCRYLLGFSPASLEAGLDWYNSCEPIGPEHTVEEVVEQIFMGMELGPCQHAVIRRFPVPGSPLFHYGRLPLACLAQVVAVVALATLETPTVRSIAVHESNVLGLMSGANALYPEAGEPTQTVSDFAGELDGDKEGFSSALWRRSQEITTADCRNMLVEAGYDRVVTGPGKSTALRDHQG